MPTKEPMEPDIERTLSQAEASWPRAANENRKPDEVAPMVKSASQRELQSMRDEQTNIRMDEKGVDYSKHEIGPETRTGETESSYDAQLREAAEAGRYRQKDTDKGRSR